MSTITIPMSTIKHSIIEAIVTITIGAIVGYILIYMKAGGSTPTDLFLITVFLVLLVSGLIRDTEMALASIPTAAAAVWATSGEYSPYILLVFWLVMVTHIGTNQAKEVNRTLKSIDMLLGNARSYKTNGEFEVAEGLLLNMKNGNEAINKTINRAIDNLWQIKSSSSNPALKEE